MPSRMRSGPLLRIYSKTLRCRLPCSSKDFLDHAAKDRRCLPYSRIVSVFEITRLSMPIHRLRLRKDLTSCRVYICINWGASLRANFH